MILSSCSANCCDSGTVFPSALWWHSADICSQDQSIQVFAVPGRYQHCGITLQEIHWESQVRGIFLHIKATEGQFSVLSWAWIHELKYKHHLTPALGGLIHRYFLKCCIYLAEFEILNIPYTYESFHKSPKEGMIKGLWKNHSHEPRVGFLNPSKFCYTLYEFTPLCKAQACLNIFLQCILEMTDKSYTLSKIRK